MAEVLSGNGLRISVLKAGTVPPDRREACVAKKFQSSLAVKGELPEDGLAAYGDDDDGLMMALARQIISGEEDEESVEAVLARSRNAKSVSEELLVEDGWHAVEGAI